jgi:hypothetical protein
MPSRAEGFASGKSINKVSEPHSGSETFLLAAPLRQGKAFRRCGKFCRDMQKICFYNRPEKRL